MAWSPSRRDALLPRQHTDYPPHGTHRGRRRQQCGAARRQPVPGLSVPPSRPGLGLARCGPALSSWTRSTPAARGVGLAGWLSRDTPMAAGGWSLSSTSRATLWRFEFRYLGAQYAAASPRLSTRQAERCLSAGRRYPVGTIRYWSPGLIVGALHEDRIIRAQCGDLPRLRGSAPYSPAGLQNAGAAGRNSKEITSCPTRLSAPIARAPHSHSPVQLERRRRKGGGLVSIRPAEWRSAMAMRLIARSSRGRATGGDPAGRRVCSAARAAHHRRPG